MIGMLTTSQTCPHVLGHRIWFVCRIAVNAFGIRCSTLVFSLPSANCNIIVSHQTLHEKRVSTLPMKKLSEICTWYPVPDPTGDRDNLYISGRMTVSPQLSLSYPRLLFQVLKYKVEAGGRGTEARVQCTLQYGPRPSMVGGELNSPKSGASLVWLRVRQNQLFLTDSQFPSVSLSCRGLWERRQHLHLFRKGKGKKKGAGRTPLRPRPDMDTYDVLTKKRCHFIVRWAGEEKTLRSEFF